jgi:hypothetical protein
MSNEMKYIVNSQDHKAVNLANVIGISISNNYLMLSLTDGREMRFFYGTENLLNDLFSRIMDFIDEDGTSVLDCN